MSFSSFKARISFQVKVLAPVVLVMVMLTALTGWLMNRRIGDQLETQATERLDTAQKLFRTSLEFRESSLRAQFNNFDNEPHYKDFIQTGTENFFQAQVDNLLGFDSSTLTQKEAEEEIQKVRTATDTKFLEDLLKERDIKTAACTFPGGDYPLFACASSDPLIDTNELRSQSLVSVRQAYSQRKPVVDTIAVGSRLLDVVSIPVSFQNELVGVVTFGLEIGPAEARQIKQMTGSEVLLLANGNVAASSLRNAESHPELAGQVAGLPANSKSTPENQARKIRLGGQHFLCVPGRFASLGSNSRLGYVLASSYESAWRDWKETQQLLLLIGLMGTVAGAGVIWLLVRRVTQPLRQLRDSAEAVGRGDFSKHVEVSSRDECGELAAVFNQMTENIKTSRGELEKTVETLKTTQNQLIQSEKLSGIGEFVAGVAHELNNPLTSVMGFAELLQQSDLPEQPRKYLDVIFKSAKRCTKIVQSLLSFARRHAPERKVICVNEIVESAVEILQYQMRTSNIEVVTQLDPNLPASEVDPHQMQQVFLNIINNARQAMEGRQARGRLRVTTESSGEWVRVIFQDNGPGIPADNLKKIFNPFFTTKEVGKGTGLGLSLCYGIVGEHGGTITPESQEGEGATFIIELPIARKPAGTVEKKAAATVAANPSQEGVGKRVLVVDDEDSILQMVREVLTMNGYKVDVAHDGETALRQLGEHHYDLALCDWKMPGLNGEQVYERLHATDPEMSKRLIFITGDVVNERTQAFLRSRNKVCLSKPFTLVDFRSAISRVMAAGKDA